MLLLKTIFKFNTMLKFSNYVPPKQEIPKLFTMLTNSRKENFQIIQQIVKQYNPYSHNHLLTHDRKKILIKEFERYKNGKGYFDKIATIAWAIKQLGMEKECKSLLNQFIQRIENDEWYVNFDESIRAIETFFEISSNKKSKIYQKIERNIALTLWENNQIYYQKITTALVKAERFDSMLWETVEFYCLRNLSMEYHPMTAITILLNFAKADQGSAMFYDTMMRLFYKGGHLFQMNPLLTLVHHSYQSSSVSAIIQAFGRASLKHKELQILSQFKHYVYRLFFNNNFHLQQLSHVSSILKYTRVLGFSEQEVREIDIRVFSKLPQIQRIGDPRQIIQFYDTLCSLRIDVPLPVNDYLAGYLFVDSLSNGKSHPEKHLRVYNYLKDNGLQGNTKLDGFVIDWLNSRSNTFDSQQLRFIMKWVRERGLLIQTKGGKLKIVSKVAPEELSTEQKIKQIQE